ncbi:aldo/keto reductase [Puia sp. P3]|uniref:aldo/keto reductase n=1 Tax=Puia sp. P3 TaxID=3423952 RepID=UPI003D675F10
MIRWTLDRPGITIALVGARNAQQAVQNAGAIRVRLSAEEVAMIDAKLAGLRIE